LHLLEHFRTVHRLEPEAENALAAIVTEHSYPKNAIIQPLGSRCRTVYFVKSGCARIHYLKDGHDITEHFAFANQIIVRAESLFAGSVTRKGIEAIANTEVYAIDAPALFRLYDAHHGIERLFRLLFEAEYVATVKRIESLQFMTAKERYLELLSTTDYVQKIPLRFIAGYLGITQVSLSRIRASI